jgi:hypothetical protein
MLKEIESKDFGSMDKLHHILAGFKAMATDQMMEGVEACRRSTGGAGY